MLEQSTPDSSAIIIEENLNKSITYNLELKSAELRREDQNSWLVEVEYTLKPYELNKPLAGNHHRPVELGLYDEQSGLIRLLPIVASESENTTWIEMASKPHRLVLDPNYLILDTERINNSITLDE
jgi:hypothetical protein